MSAYDPTKQPYDEPFKHVETDPEREVEAREECARRGLDPDDYAADGVLVWMVVAQEMRR